MATVESDPNLDAELLVLAARAFAVCSAAAANDPALASDYRDKTFAVLRRVLAGGYQDLFTLQVEPDFDPIRNDPRFAELVSESTIGQP